MEKIIITLEFLQELESKNLKLVFKNGKFQIENK